MYLLTYILPHVLSMLSLSVFLDADAGGLPQVTCQPWPHKGAFSSNQQATKLNNKELPCLKVLFLVADELC